MVSVVQSEDANPRANQRMYCHSCSYEFYSNSQNGLIACPRCHEGFIEEVNDDISQRSNSPNFLDDFLSSMNTQNQLARNQFLRVSVVVNSVNNISETDANRLNRLHRIGNRSGSIYVTQLPIEDMLNFMPSQSPPVMTEEQLQEIPKATITEEQTQIQCAVCFDNFALNENEVRQLQCNHLYHEKCIFPWVQNNGTCPVCRAPLPNANLENNHASSSSIENFFENLLSHPRAVRVDSVSQMQQLLSQRPSTSASATANTHQTRNLQPRAQRVQAPVGLERFNSGFINFMNATSSGNFLRYVTPIQARGHVANAVPSPPLTQYSHDSPPVLSPQDVRTPSLSDLRRVRVRPAATANAHHSLTPPRVQRLRRNHRIVRNVQTRASTSTAASSHDQLLISATGDQRSQRNRRLPESARPSTSLSLPNRPKRKRTLPSKSKADSKVILLSSSSDDDSDSTICMEPARKQIKIEDSDSSS